MVSDGHHVLRSREPGVLYTLMTKVYWVIEEAAQINYITPISSSYRRAESIMGKTGAEEQADVLGCMI